MTSHSPAAPEQDRATDASPGHQGRLTALRLVAVAAVVVGTVLLGAFFLLAQLADETQEVPVATPVVEEQLSEAAFAEVLLGTAKEQALEALLPVQPVDSRLVDRDEAREPEAVESECVYYEREDGAADERYRLCFAEDVLVDKTVVFPDEPGVR